MKRNRGTLIAVALGVLAGLGVTGQLTPDLEPGPPSEDARKLLRLLDEQPERWHYKGKWPEDHHLAGPGCQEWLVYRDAKDQDRIILCIGNRWLRDSYTKTGAESKKWAYINHLISWDDSLHVNRKAQALYDKLEARANAKKFDLGDDSDKNLKDN
jgi:hypothetical protein